MYESHFNFTAAPFGLNPDPDFYFGSRGHSSALSYLQFGVYQAEGFVVVTGEIGAGKTTLVRTLLSELDKDKIVAAQIVSTQLEAGDLLRSVALSFGIAPKSLSKPELIATIEAFLTSLVTENRRALLIVDEAQNLNREAVEELRMLSNFQLGNRALLQSFLVGQPELRVLLTSKPMEQFRQRVIASCHLGPMDMQETQAYVEHRLHQVGWKDHPVFSPEAFERIHHFTSGIPRRVNLLCNRLLLAAYLGSLARIDAALVDTVGDEVRSEVGNAGSDPTANDSPTVASPDAAESPAAASAAALASAVPAAPRLLVVAKSQSATSASNAGPLLCVAANRFDDAKMAMLLRALKSRHGLPPQLRIRIGEDGDFALNDAFFRRSEVDVPVLDVDVCEPTPTAQIAEVLKRFTPMVDKLRPSAVIVAGSSDSMLACSLVARKKGLRLIHLDAGRRAASSSLDDVNSVLSDRMADLLLASDTSGYLNLIREGVSESRAHLTGSLLVDAVRLAAQGARPAEQILMHHGAAVSQLKDSAGYGVVAIESAALGGTRQLIAELIDRLREMARNTPLVWVMGAAVGRRLEAMGLSAAGADGRIAVVPALDFEAMVGLLKSASFLVTDSQEGRLQAAALQVRCLMAERLADGPIDKPAALKQPDGEAAQRVAEHLVQWLASKVGSVRPGAAVA